MNFNKYLYGSVYRPEWDRGEDILSEDISLMKQLCFNMVILPPDVIERASAAEAETEKLRQLLSVLEENGIGVMAGVGRTLPPGELIKELDASETVRFFMAGGPDCPAAEILSALRDAGVTKPLAALCRPEDLYGSCRAPDEADVICYQDETDWACADRDKNMYEASAYADWLRCLGGRKLIKVGIDPCVTMKDGVRRLRRPGTLSFDIYHAAAHGAGGFFYRNFRQEMRGEDRRRGGLIDHTGRTGTRVLEEAGRLGRLLKELRVLTEKDILSSQAVFVNGDAGPEKLLRYYRIIRNSGLNADFINEESDFSRYSLIIAPELTRISEETAGKIRQFVHEGGVWFSHLSPCDETGDGALWEGDAPHALTDVFGIRITDLDELPPGEKTALDAAPDFRGHFLAEGQCGIVCADDAEVLMSYAGQFYEGTPCLTRKHFGRGFAYYLACGCAEELSWEICTRISGITRKQAKNRRIDGIAMQRFDDDEAEYLVFLNYSDRERRLPLEYNKLDILFGYDPLPVWGAMVLKVLKTGSS